jgi:uncharacterized repeat protein (TIGR01451 family)
MPTHVSPSSARAHAAAAPPVCKEARPRSRVGLRVLVLALALILFAAIAPAAQATNKRPNGEVIATCNSITFVFNGFPNLPNNTVKEKVFVHHELVYEGSFTFNGSEGQNTIPITVPAGLGQVDGKASWNTNGFKSEYDVATALNCSKPAFTIEKLQKIEGNAEEFSATSEPVAKVGATVLYEIIVRNTGNTVLTFSKFLDPRCDTITGGTTEPVSPGASTTFFCKHTILESDYTKLKQVYENSATVTGTPPKNEGSTSTHTSNIVVVLAPSPHERPNGEVKATCHSITFVFKGFPNLPNNTVKEKVYVHGKLVYEGTFTFNGPTGMNTIPITVPPGNGTVDGKASWNTNGFKGEYDIATGLKCPAEPAFTIQKQQKIEGSNEGFTTGTLSGQVGQTVDYQVTVTNTGNVPLTFSSFTDANCSGIAGGPSGALEIGKSATYTCSHTLVLADANKPYENSATVTGTPPAGQGSAIMQTSNTVVTNVPFTVNAAFTIEKLQRDNGEPVSYTSEEVKAPEASTIEYEVVVTNTGNVPLKFGELVDPNCSGITGGSGEEAVAPGKSTTFFCSHVVTQTDVEAKTYSNTATITGTPPPGDGESVNHESNTVVAAAEALI